MKAVSGTNRKRKRVAGLNMSGVTQDIRFGTRALRRAPAFSIVSTLTLALGIGATTAIFSVVNSVLFRPLPYPNSSDLVAVWRTNERIDDGAVSYLDFRDWRSMNGSFVEMGGYYGDTKLFARDYGTDELKGAAFTHGMLPMLGVRPDLGRWFLEDEDRIGGPSAVILRHDVWRGRFGADSSIVGRSIVMDAEPVTVVGVMPQGFSFPDAGTEFWVPCREDEVLRLAGVESPGRDLNFLGVVGRLKPDADIGAASRDIKSIVARIEAEEPSVRPRGVRLESLHSTVVGDTHAMLFTFLGAVAMVLAIACANVANLSLVRAASRRREIAVRTALGAGRWRIMRQLITESVLLALAGGAAGILVALGTIELFAAFGSGLLPRGEEVSLDATALVFAAGVSLASGLLFGLFPAAQATGHGLELTLRDESRGTTSGRRGQVVRQALVVAQVALALMLLTGGALLMNSYLRLIAVDPGFDSENVLTAWVELPADRYEGKDDAVLAFFDELHQRLAALPGVSHTSFSYSLPFAENNFAQVYEAEGREVDGSGEGPWAGTVIVGQEYFAAAGLRMLRGRGFDARDRGGPRVAVINETMAEQAWPDQDPINRRFRTVGAVRGSVGSLDRRFYSRDWVTVVGVVSDVHRYGLDEETAAEFYRPHSQKAWTGMSLLVRASEEPAQLAGAVRREVWAVDDGVAVTNVSTMRDLIDRSVATPRFRTVLLTAFAIAAGLLTVVGVYGVMAFVVVQLTQEIGIRMALGAKQDRVLGEILVRGIRLAGLGVLVGLIGSVAAARVLSSMLYGISTHDPSTFAAAVLALMISAVLACYLPARRASRVDPLIALRKD
jgi:putative ABC transport system permease protein